MKKNYTVSLDKEVVEIIQPYLEKQGMTFSGFLNQAAVEYLGALQSLNLPDDVSKMPLGEFVTMFSRMIRGMKEKKK
jgi:hypothetical protein